MPSLPCLNMATLLLDPRCSSATWNIRLVDVDRCYAGRLRQRHALTCHLTVDANAPAAKKHSGRSWRNRRNSDGPGFSHSERRLQSLSLSLSSGLRTTSWMSRTLRKMLRFVEVSPHGPTGLRKEYEVVSDLAEPMSSVGPGGVASTPDLWSDSESSSDNCGHSHQCVFSRLIQKVCVERANWRSRWRVKQLLVRDQLLGLPCSAVLKARSRRSVLLRAARGSLWRCRFPW